MKSKVISIACVLALAMAGAPGAFAYDGASPPTAEDVAADTLVVRPACLVATIVGSAIFVISLPFAAASRSVHRAADALVVRPAHATFTRPLGDLESLSGY
jgi:hypothetical protein